MRILVLRISGLVKVSISLILFQYVHFVNESLKHKDVSSVRYVTKKQ